MEIYHVYSTFDNMSSTRYEVAKKTWNLIDTIKVPVHENLLETNLVNDGYRKVPYVNDIINKAIELINNQENYIILFTNSDSCLISSIINDLKKVDDSNTQVYSRREVNFDYTVPLKYEDIYNLDVYVGKDGFAFTKNYWNENKFKFLKMIFGAEFWDYIFYIQFKMYSNLSSINDKIYHRTHDVKWFKPEYRYTTPSQVHNIRLARDFLRKNIDMVDRYDHMKIWENDVFIKV